jgi:hypothetical protein
MRSTGQQPNINTNNRGWKQRTAVCTLSSKRKLTNGPYCSNSSKKQRWICSTSKETTENYNLNSTKNTNRTSNRKYSNKLLTPTLSNSMKNEYHCNRNNCNDWISSSIPNRNTSLVCSNNLSSSERAPTNTNPGYCCNRSRYSDWPPSSSQPPIASTSPDRSSSVWCPKYSVSTIPCVSRSNNPSVVTRTWRNCYPVLRPSNSRTSKWSTNTSCSWINRNTSVRSTRTQRNTYKNMMRGNTPTKAVSRNSPRNSNDSRQSCRNSRKRTTTSKCNTRMQKLWSIR